MFPSRICRSQVFLARYTGSSGDGGDEGAIPLKRVFIGFPYALDYVFIRWVRWPRKFIVDFMDIDRIYRFLRVEGRRRMIIRTRLFELRRWGAAVRSDSVGQLAPTVGDVLGSAHRPGEVRSCSPRYVASFGRLGAFTWASFR